MVNYCRVNGCTNRSDREKHLSFYRLPEVITNQGEKTQKYAEERRRLWLANLDQNFSGKNMKNIRVCSAHFVTGKRAELYDRDNPDWVPSVNMGSKPPRTTPAVMKHRYERRVMREKKTEAARTLVFLSDQLCETEMDCVENEPECASNEIGCQTEMLGSDIELMAAELQQLRTENINLKENLKNLAQYSQDAFEGNDEKVKMFTGLPDFMTLVALFGLLEPHLPVKQSIGKFECLTVALVRLRLNLPVNYLAYQLGVSKATISRVFLDTVDVMYGLMKSFIMWPDREELRKTMPRQFQERFGKKCAVIIDCFEVFIDRPSNLLARAKTWSSYKHHNTVKFLIGITPQGTVSYLSRSWGGRSSDKHITENCGFLNNILPGDLILADRGFDIDDIVGTLCGEVQIPAFTKGKDQLSAIDIETTRKLASVRIHVERVIGVTRQKYTILNSTLPLDFLMTKDNDGIPTVDKIAHVCCSLVNLCDTVVLFD